MDVTFVNPIDGPCLSLMVPVLSFPLPRAQGAPPGVQAPRVARRGRPRHRRPRAHPLRPRPPPRPRRLRQGQQPIDAAVRRERAHGASQGHGVGVPLPAVREHGGRARPPPARHCGGEVRGARRAAEQGLQELIELEASQATKTDHTEAEVLAEAERLRAEEEARLAGEAAARAAEEAARLLAKQCARDKRQ